MAERELQKVRENARLQTQEAIIRDGDQRWAGYEPVSERKAFAEAEKMAGEISKKCSPEVVYAGWKVEKDIDPDGDMNEDSFLATPRGLFQSLTTLKHKPAYGNVKARLRATEALKAVDRSLVEIIRYGSD